MAVTARRRVAWARNALAIGALLVQLLLSGPPDGARADDNLRASADVGAGGPWRGTIAWRPGKWRLDASFSEARPDRLFLAGPGPGVVAAWAVGHVHLAWARGASGWPAAPGRALAVSAAGGGRGGPVRAAAIIRVGPGDLLVVAGSRGSDGRRRRDLGGRPSAAIAWACGQSGILVSGGRGQRGLASVALGWRGRGRRGQVELVAGGEQPTLAAWVAEDIPGLAAELDFRVPAGGGFSRRSEFGPALDLLLRAHPAPLRASLGASASLPAGVQAQDATSRRRIWIEAAIPSSSSIEGLGAVVRCELRRAGGADRSRLRAELRTPLMRTAAEWTAGGGLLVRSRSLWPLAAGAALEAGAAAWSGPVAGTGASIDLPAVPDHGLPPRLARPGGAASLLLSWQVGRVRVRLGWSARQARNVLSDSRFAARVDLGASPVTPMRPAGSSRRSGLPPTGMGPRVGAAPAACSEPAPGFEPAAEGATPVAPGSREDTE